MMKLQEQFNFGAADSVEILKNSLGEEGRSYRWTTDQMLFTDVVAFLLDEDRDQQPSDMSVYDTSTGELITMADDTDKRRMVRELIQCAGNLPTASILTVNFEEPPVSVHMFSQEATATLSSVDPSSIEAGAAILEVCFGKDNPPTWLNLES